MPQVYGLVNRTKPGTTGDAAQAQLRVSRYGDLSVVPISAGLYHIADEGSYFRAINPTPGTGIAQAITAAFSATAGLIRLRNGDVAGGKRIFIDYCRLIPTVAPASSTRSELLIALDDINRFSSGGSTLTPRNVNMDSTTGTVATVNAGALVLAAEGLNVRRVSRAQIRTAILVPFEEVLINCGSMGDGSNTISGAVGVRLSIPVGPCIIGPGHDWIVHIWHPGNATTGASWEIELAWWER